MANSICVLGDSVASGVIYLADSDRYVHYEDCFVNLLARETGLQIANRSSFGCTTSAALRKLRRYERDIAESDLTLIMLGGNDSDYDWPAVAATPEEPHDCVTSMADFRRGYNELIDRVLALGGTPVVSNITPVFGKPFYRWICRRADGDALLRFLGDETSIERGNELYSLAVTEIAAKRGLPFIDARSALLQKRRLDTGVFCADGIHPSPMGHRELFNYVLPQIRELTERL